MTEKERDDFLQILGEFSKREMIQIFKDKNPALSINSLIPNSQKTYSRAIVDLEISMLKLERELESENYLFLQLNFLPISIPAQFRSSGSNVHVPLESITVLWNNAILLIKSNKWYDFLGIHRKIVQYQMIHGFWYLPLGTKESSGLLDLAESRMIVEDLGAKVNNMHEVILQELNHWESLKQEGLVQLRNSNEALSTIQERQNVSEKTLENIQKLHLSIKELSGEIKANADSTREVLSQLKGKQVEEEKVFQSFKLENEKIIEEVVNFQRATEESHSKSKKVQEEIESKRIEINKLLGLANDGALSAWFKEREENVGRKLKWWSWLLPFVLVGAVSWIVAVFVAFSADGQNEYLNFVINTIKTIPAFLAIGFGVRQYTRERLIQEEYAFRSAISQTIKTYSDMLGESEMANETARTEMLKEILRQIYVMPKLYSERSPHLIKFRSKDMTEVLKQFTEAIKEVKPGK